MINKKILSLSLIAATALSVPAMAKQSTTGKMAELEARITRLEKGDARDAKVIHESADSKAHIQLSGQVNRAVTFVDNRERHRTTFVDSNNEPTKLTIDGQYTLGCYKVGAVIEAGFQENDSMGPNFTNRDSGKDYDWRKADLYVASQYATVRLGKGDMVSENTSENDLSGTGVAAYGPAVHYMAGNFPFQKSNRLIRHSWYSFDGFGRANRVAIETNPALLSGLSFGAGHATSDRTDVAAKYAAQIGAFRVQAAVAGIFGCDEEFSPWGEHISAEAYGHYRQVNGSMSVLHDSGLSLTLAGAQRRYHGRDKKLDLKEIFPKNTHMWFTKVGYKFRVLELGDTAFAINYGQNKDLIFKGERAETYGAALVQHVEEAGAEVYLAGQAFDMKKAKVEKPKKPIYAVTFGARVKF